MRLYILLLLLNLSIIPLTSQNTANPKKTIMINDILSFYQFEEIRSYILNNGNKQEYCEQSGNVPHLKVLDTDIDLYLISFSQKKTLNIEDYNVIYLVTTFNDIPYNYYLYLTNNGKVYLYDYKNTLRNEEITKEALDKLRNKVPDILKTIARHQ